MRKARLVFRDGQWWCLRMGVTGCGPTPKAAWDDMWQLYRDAVMPKRQVEYRKVRFA